MGWAAGYSLQNGKYIIKEGLGQGGFGITYKAWHTSSRRDVVIKTPNEYLQYDPDYKKYVERFNREGLRLKQLSQDPHPHIVRFWDFFEENGVPCIVMDFVPGEDLSQMVRRRGALSETEILPCICQIGKALSVIHQAGLVHRDAHPGNIIVRPDGRTILIDFGIAKELIPSTQSSTGNAGNRGFAPYEQMIEGSREPTVDVYCLAATLYFAVTGQRPVTSLERKLNNTKLIPPKRLNADLSEWLNQAILRGMALEPKNRPQSMQEWIRLLEKPNAVVWERLFSNLAQWTSALWHSSSKTSESKEEQQDISYTLQSRYPFYPEPTLRQGRSIPWDWLMFPFTGFVAAGFIFSQLVDLQALSMSLLMSVSAWLSSLAWAVSGTLTNVRANNGEWSISNQWVRAWVRAWNRTLFNFLESIKDSTLLLTWFIIGVLVSRSIFIWARGQYWTMVLTGFVFIVAAITDVRRYRLGIYIGGRLLQSFGGPGTFLILVGISAIGLILGWLVGLAL